MVRTLQAINYLSLVTFSQPIYYCAEPQTHNPWPMTAAPRVIKNIHAGRSIPTAPPFDSVEPGAEAAEVPVLNVPLLLLRPGEDELPKCAGADTDFDVVDDESEALALALDVLEALLLVPVTEAIASSNAECNAALGLGGSPVPNIVVQIVFKIWVIDCGVAGITRFNIPRQGRVRDRVQIRATFLGIVAVCGGSGGDRYGGRGQNRKCDTAKSVMVSVQPSRESWDLRLCIVPNANNVGPHAASENGKEGDTVKVGVVHGKKQGVPCMKTPRVPGQDCCGQRTKAPQKKGGKADGDCANSRGDNHRECRGFRWGGNCVGKAQRDIDRPHGQTPHNGASRGAEIPGSTQYLPPESFRFSLLVLLPNG